MCRARVKLRRPPKNIIIVFIDAIEHAAAHFGCHWSSIAPAEGCTYRCNPAAGREGAGRAGARPERRSEHGGALEARRGMISLPQRQMQRAGAERGWNGECCGGEELCL